MHQVEDEAHVVLPDRPTLTHFALAKRSPFGRYLGLSAVDSWPPPFCHVHLRLGLSKEAFETEMTLEIDIVLLDTTENRRRAMVSDCEAPSTSEPPPSLPIFSKEDFQK